MTHNEFAAWLNGFLDGKLSPEDVERVRMKALEVISDMPHLPASPAPWYINPPVWPHDTAFNPWIYPPVVTCDSIESQPIHGQMTWNGAPP